MNYEATLVIFGKKYVAVGKTAREAIENLELKNAKGSGILILKHGKEKREKIVNQAQMFRLFNASALMREVALKNMEILFNGL